jgi:hypothetical protein
MAVETGVETGTLFIAGHEASNNHRVTNVYRQVGGNWRLAHHHTDVSEAMLEILKRLSAAALHLGLEAGRAALAVPSL